MAEESIERSNVDPGATEATSRRAYDPRMRRRCVWRVALVRWP